MKHYRTFVALTALSSVFGTALHASEGLESLSPVMNIPNQIAYESDFSRSEVIDKQKRGNWQARQGTQWEVVDGVLRGKQSPPEYQAQKPQAGLRRVKSCRRQIVE